MAAFQRVLSCAAAAGGEAWSERAAGLSGWLEADVFSAMAAGFWHLPFPRGFHLVTVRNLLFVFFVFDHQGSLSKVFIAVARWVSPAPSASVFVLIPMPLWEAVSLKK